jgi:7-cyano-7-deazaguanine synthase
MGNDVIAICSGGLDSTVLYFHLKSLGNNVIPLNFSYGSKHNKIERKAAEKIFGKELLKIDIDLSFLNSSLIKKDMIIPEGHYESENMKSTVVPFRNGIMLSYAVAMAENEKINRVAIGAHSGDHFIYPDCRPEFIENFAFSSKLGTSNQVSVIAPFVSMSKANVVKIGKDLGIVDILFSTWTCYKGLDIHCGKCGSCIERIESFEKNEIEDRTRYNNV